MGQRDDPDAWIIERVTFLKSTIILNPHLDSEKNYFSDTARSTPVWANHRYLEADLRIVVGDIEPHQFQGFSGGVKSAAIGLAGKPTVNANHAMMTDPRAQIGRYEDNPCRQDVEEIGRMMGVHFASRV